MYVLIHTRLTCGLFGRRNKRNSIRNIEVSVPSREVSKATICSSRLLRKEGWYQRGCRGDRAMLEEMVEDAMEVEDALQWVLRQRARSV